MDLQVSGDLEELDPERWKQSQLLTDRDPVLGGTQALCDTAGTHYRALFIAFKFIHCILKHMNTF